MSMKNPMKLVGIEPATFQFVAQHLDRCATAVPSRHCNCYNLPYPILFVEVWVHV